MADFLVYWKVFWRDNPNGSYVVDFLWHTKQGFWRNVAAGDSLWVVASGGDQFPDEWRLVERIVVQKKFVNPDFEWPNGFSGDPTKSEAYQVHNQADLTTLLHRFEFVSGTRITVSGRTIGNAIQKARPLSVSDGLLLEEYARGLVRIDVAGTLDGIVGVSEEDFTPRLTPTGAGFGDPETNRKVERAAVSAVTEWYESEGWAVKSVEAENCGYDLLCQKGSDVKHVEVKGVQGGLVAFIITANEERQARNDSDFVLCVVTSALTDKRKLSFYDAASFVQDFELSPLAYRAVLRK